MTGQGSAVARPRVALADLQQQVQAHLLDGGPLPASLRDAVREPAELRWRLYSDAYRIRLVEGLKEAYPAFVQRLGDETASTLLLDFVTSAPSTHRSLRDYGAELAPHLARDAADAPGSELHLAAELAEFEWALAGAFDAVDAPAVTHDDLAATPAAVWATQTFATAPCVRRLRLRTNAPECWRAAVAEPPIDGPAVRLEEMPVDWLIWRDGFAPRFRWMEPDEAEAFDACASGASFGDLCERLVDALGDEALLRAASWLKAWTADGLLVRG